MTEYLAIFRSRTQAIDCGARLKAFGIPAKIINTPKEAGVGCGLSLKFSALVAPRAKAVINRANYSAFYGYMRAQ